MLVLGKWTPHKPASKEEDVAGWGCWLICQLLSEAEGSLRTRWLNAGVERVLRAILAHTEASSNAKADARKVLKALGLRESCLLDEVLSDALDCI